jgi:RNA polymerase sigma-70 factor (ECF subfamily)
MVPPLPPELGRRFEAEILPHLDVMYRMAMMLARDPEHAQDLAQEAALKALQGYPRLEHRSNLRSWLARIVHTTFLDRLRLERRRPEESLEELGEDVPPGDADTQGWEPAVLRDGFQDDLEEGLGSLPAGWRALVLIIDVEGWSYEEAAETLDVPIGTIRSRLHRARQRLYQHLQRRGHAAPRQLKARAESGDSET